MKLPLLIAGALLCASISVSAQDAPCATIADLAEAAFELGGHSAIVAVVKADTQNVDYLVVFKDVHGNISIMGERDGCLFGEPILLDHASKETPA